MANEKLHDAQKELRSLADAVDASNLQRFFKTGPGEYGEGDVFLGVRVPVTRKVVRKYRKTLLDEAARILRSKYHEERLMALMILVEQSKSGSAADQRAIYSFYLRNTDRVNNWDLVDCSAPQIVGGYLFERNRLPLYRLARSTNLWERRISILATFYLIKRDDFADTLALADILLAGC